MRRRGFTLVELLLVVVILAAVAASATAMLEGADTQVRYDDTKSRLESLRRAIVGPEDAAAPQGFAADMGRLPQSLAELLVLPAGARAYGVTSSGVGTGWRGPYLRTPPSSTGTPFFPDGWGNGSEVDPNYGWSVTGPPGLRMASAGGAGQPGPAVTLLEADWAVDVRNWSVSVAVVNTTTTTVIQDLTLRLVVPATSTALDGVPPDGLDDTSFIATQPGVALQAGQTTPVSFTFTFPSLPSGPVWVAAGVRGLRLDLDLSTTPVISTNPATPGRAHLVVLSARAPLPTQERRFAVVPP